MFIGGPSITIILRISSTTRKNDIFLIIALQKDFCLFLPLVRSDPKKASLVPSERNRFPAYAAAQLPRRHMARERVAGFCSEGNLKRDRFWGRVWDGGWGACSECNLCLIRQRKVTELIATPCLHTGVLKYWNHEWAFVSSALVYTDIPNGGGLHRRDTRAQPDVLKTARIVDPKFDRISMDVQ